MRRILSALLLLLSATLAHAQGVINFGGNGGGSGNPIGAGVSFAGSQSALFAAPAASLQFNAPFTISTWVRGAMGSGNTYLVDSTGGSSVAGMILVNAPTFAPFSLELVLRPNTTGCAQVGRVCTRVTPLQDGNWHLITGTYDGTTLSLYVDAQPADHLAGAFTFAPGTSYWQVGTSEYPFSERDLRLYTRMLAPSEIQYLYGLGVVGLVPSSGPLTTGMAGYWPLDACSPSCADSSGNGNTLIAVSTPPTVAVTVPSAGAVMTGTVTLTATCTDPVQVGTVQMRVDGSPASALLTTAPYTTSFDSTVLVDGAHAVTATCIGIGDNSGTSASVAVTSSNGVTAKSYYLSAAGSGTTCSIGSPCAIAGLAGVTFNEDDQILWNGGDNITGCLQALTSTNTRGRATHPVILTNYGVGTATYTSNCTGGTRQAAIQLTDVHGITVNGLIMRSSGVSGLNCGIVVSETTGTSGGILLENNNIMGFTSNATQLAAGNFCANVFVQAYPGLAAPGCAIDGISILNNTIHGATSAAADDNGIYGFGNGVNICNAVYQGNTVYNIGGHPAYGVSGNGIEISGTQGAIAQFNVVHDNGGNNTACGGPVGIISVASNSPVFQFNEVYSQQPLVFGGCDNGGLDFDLQVTNGIMRYNYTHDNWEYGITMYISGAWGPNYAYYNISNNDALHQGSSLQVSNMTTTATWGFFNNTVYSDNTKDTWALLATDGCYAHAIIANNIFAKTVQDVGFQSKMIRFGYGSSATKCPATVKILNNAYYTPSGNPVWIMEGTNYGSLVNWKTGIAVNGGDANATNANPTFVGPVGTGLAACGSTSGPQPCPAGFALGGGSTYKNTGLDLTGAPYNLSVGTRDYFGVTIPTGTGTGYPIGAAN